MYIQNSMPENIPNPNLLLVSESPSDRVGLTRSMVPNRLEVGDKDRIQWVKSGECALILLQYPREGDNHPKHKTKGETSTDRGGEKG